MASNAGDAINNWPQGPYDASQYHAGSLPDVGGDGLSSQSHLSLQQHQFPDQFAYPQPHTYHDASPGATEIPGYQAQHQIQDHHPGVMQHANNSPQRGFPTGGFGTLPSTDAYPIPGFGPHGDLGVPSYPYPIQGSHPAMSWQHASDYSQMQNGLVSLNVLDEESDGQQPPQSQGGHPGHLYVKQGFALSQDAGNRTPGYQAQADLNTPVTVTADHHSTAPVGPLPGRSEQVENRNGPAAAASPAVNSGAVSSDTIQTNGATEQQDGATTQGPTTQRVQYPTTQQSAAQPVLRKTTTLLQQAPSSAGASWPGVKNIVIGTPTNVPEAANLTRMRRLDLDILPRGKLLFPGRSGPIPAEIRGIMAWKWKNTAIPFKGDLALLRQRARAAYAKIGRTLDDKFLAADEEEKSRMPPKSDTVASLTLNGAAAKAAEYLGWEDWFAKDRELASDSAKSFTAFFRSLRMMIKNARDALDTADQADQESKSHELAAKRSVVEAVVQVALQWATSPVVEALAKIKDDPKVQVVGQLVFLLVNDVLKATDALETDINGPYTKAILKLLARLHPTEEVLDQLKFRKLVVLKYKANGDDDVKKLLGAIIQDADKAEVKDGSPGKSSAAREPSSTKDDGKPTVATANRSTSTAAPLKRRPDDNIDPRLTKKTATSTPTTGLSVGNNNSSTVPPATTTTAIKPSTLPVVTTRGNLSLGGRPRGTATNSSSTTAAPKAVSDKPASKAPSEKPPAKITTEPNNTAPSTADMAPTPKPQPAQGKPAGSAVSDAKVKKPESANKASAAAGPSTFSSIMAAINEPKVPQQPAAPSAEPVHEKEETPEEKDRRLRKEKRRSLKLRVSWRPDDELTSTRIFEKDASEAAGISSNMKRDARDDRSEGMTLKRSKERDTAEDEEDEEEYDVPNRTWYEPTPVDFSAIPEEKRAETWATRGGHKTVHTEEQKRMEERENTVLSVHYTDEADIPPTPKSPPPEPADAPFTAPPEGIYLPTDDPRFQEIHRRNAEWYQFGPKRMVELARQRKEVQKNPQAPPAAAAAQASATQWYDPAVAKPRDAAVAKLLNSDAVLNWTDPNPDAVPPPQRTHNHPNPDVQKADDAITNIIEQNKLSGKPAPATEPPEWMKDKQERRQEWYEGYQRDQQRQAEAARQQELQQQAQAQMAAQYSQGLLPAGAQALAGYNAGQIQQPISAPFALPYQQTAYGSQISPEAQAFLANLAVAGAGAAVGGNNAQPDPAYVQSLMQAAGATTATNNTQPAGQYTGYALASGAYNNGFDQNNASGGGRDHQQAGGSSNNNSASRDAFGGRRGDNRDRDNRDNDRTRGGYTRGGDQGASSNSDVPPHLRGINRSKIGTKSCTFYRQGKCTRGELCTFRHD